MSKRQRERDEQFLPKKPWPAREQKNKVVKTIRYLRLDGEEIEGGWEVRTELVDCISYMGRPYKDHQNRSGRFMVIRRAYTPEGEYIGDPRIARRLFKKGIRRLEKTDKKHSVCSIGFDPKKKIWYGWSHRAICGFRIGDRIYNERWKHATDKTWPRKHGDRVIEKLADAKLAARRYAQSVS